MVSYYFHPDYSGSAIQALSLSRQLLRIGASPMIVAANLSGAPSFEVLDGIAVHRIPVARRCDWQVASFAASLVSFLIRHRRDYDVIHAHGTIQHGAASLAGRLLRKPTILKVAMADSDIAFHRQGRIWGRVNRFMVARFNRYIATTPAIREEFGFQRLDTERVTLAPNAVDTELFAVPSDEERIALRARLGLPAGPIVTYVGIINARKNIDGILRIWRRSVEAGCGGHLVVVGPQPTGGAGSFQEQLAAFVREHRLEHRVTFAGHQSPVAPWLQASDIFLFPSRQEGMPNSVLEAMSCGLACVVSRSAGVDDLIASGQNGFAIDVADETAFADAVTTLLADPLSRARIGSAARQTVVSRFSLQALATTYYEMYEQLAMPSQVRPLES
jgi:glycosyltransferase involved in cell wall biosynthesis